MSLRKHLKSGQNKHARTPVITIDCEVDAIAANTLKKHGAVIEGPTSVADIIKNIDALNALANQAKSSTEDKLAFSRYKLSLMKSLLHALDLSANKQQDEVAHTKKGRALEYTKLSGFIAATLVSTAEILIWSFVGARELAKLILPGVMSPILIPVSIVFAVISVAQFLGFEIDMVKDMLGIKVKSAAVQHLENIAEQLKVLKKINSALFHANNINKHTIAEYNEYVKLAEYFNNEAIKEKQTYQSDYKEGWAKKSLRWGITAFGLLQRVIDSYFGTTMLMGMFAASLIGTPIAWAVTAVLVSTALVLYFAMQASGVNSLVNPTLVPFNKVKNKYAKLELKDHLQLTHVLSYDTLYSQKQAVKATPAESAIATPVVALDEVYPAHKSNWNGVKASLAQQAFLSRRSKNHPVVKQPVRHINTQDRRAKRK